MQQSASVRTHLDRVVRDMVRPLSLAFGLFIGYTAITELLDGSPAVVTAADVLVSVYLLALAAWVWLRPPADKWMNPLGASIALALAGTDLVTQSVRQEVPAFPATALVLAGIGAVVLSWRWVLGVQVVILTAWVVTTQLFTVNPSGAWFIIQITTITGLAIHWGRMHAYGQLIQARLNEADARRRLEAANRELDNFAAVVAHDLKNPVAAIRLKAGALRFRAPPDDHPQLETLQDLDRVADGMGTMIDDLLAYARAGEAANHRGPVDLQALAQRIQQVFEDRLHAEGGELHATDLPVVHGDETGLFQLLENLVGNALTYRREDVPPLVNLTAKVEEGGIWLRVQDNGRGFEPELAQRMFRPFERGDGDAPGHGLGLATCRRIVERHGGRIEASSVPGHGAVFEVWLPQRPEQGGASAAA